jgi:hypothetical protein
VEIFRWASIWVRRVKNLCTKPSTKHWKNQGRYRRNRLATMFFLTITSSVGVLSSYISSRQVLNPYTESGLSPTWLKEELGLPDWRIIVPVILVPHQVIPAVGQKLVVRWTLQREDKRRKKLCRKFRKKCAPWDGNVSRWIYDSEPRPPCDVPEAFFGGYADIASPTQDTDSNALLEDPIYGKSLYLWDAKGELICMQSKLDPQVERARFDTDSGTCGIDNQTSASMPPYKADFAGPQIEEKRVIHGFEGSKVYTIYKGTLLRMIKDDEGNVD